MASTMEHWICVELSKLGVDVTEENARYIIAMEGDQDMEDYLFDLLDKSDPKVQFFVSQLLKQRKHSRKNDTKVLKSTEGMVQKMYQKMKNGPDYYQGTKKQEKSEKSKTSKETVLSLNENFGLEHKPQTELNTKPVKEFSKKKSKFVSLYSKEGQARTVVKIPGRHICECQALKHELVNNCLECGRIICAQEGAGVCLFCGNLVCSKEQQKILSEGTKRSEKLHQTLMKDSDKVLQQINNQILQISKNSASYAESEEFSKAIEYKNRLLDYDKTSVKRTHVIDDDADYFSSDSQWLSKSEREALERCEEELRQIRFQSRREVKVTFDFAGRRILDANENNAFSLNNMYEDQKTAALEAKQIALIDTKDDNFLPRDLVNPAVNMHVPQFIEPDNSESIQSFSLKVDQGKRTAIRLQDKEIQEMSDEGFCLSMHQPWASLLIAGIKKHEGRTWYTSHRGKLWIASTVQIPDQEDISSTEISYRRMYKDKDLQFPCNYPSGCLLGCVELVECLEQGEYLTKFPNGESGCPYVFICENPQELLVKFPITGKHKIYKLESSTHQAAKKGIRKYIQYKG